MSDHRADFGTITLSLAQRAALLLLPFLLAPAAASADSNWPQWRGPNGDGRSPDEELPLRWSEQEGVAWKSTLPEWGTSTPAIWKNRIFVTTHVDDRDLILLCLDKTDGHVLWKQQVGTGSTPRAPSGKNSGWERRQQRFHVDHNLASPSPITDGQLIVVHFGNGLLAAYDFDGQQLWNRNLQDDYGPYTIWWGHANSPVLVGDLIISVCMQDSCADLPGKPAPSYVVAHDKHTGKLVWMTPRPTHAHAEECDSYTTPVLWPNGDHAELVVMGGQVLDGYNPTTGDRLWRLAPLGGNRVITGPVLSGNTVFVTEGMRNDVLAVELGGRGELSQGVIRWRYDHGTPDTCTPVVVGDLLFLVTDRGIAKCLDTNTGELHWQQRLPGNYRASPLASDDRVYFLNRDGLATVVSAGPEFEVVAENQLDAATLASPAISDGKLFIRGRAALYCVEGAEKTGAGNPEVDQEGASNTKSAKPPRPNILLAIADDWGWPHAGAYGDSVVKTPTFDRLAERGVLFTHAFVAAPTCTASRGALLTGQAIHRLEEGANLWSLLPGRFRVYPELLEASGYHVGLTRKGWGPGTLEGTGRTRNPAGPSYSDFATFLESLPEGKPFCFWFGSSDPHRPYKAGSGKASGMNPDDVVVPPWLPDTPEVRNDILDYYWEVQRFDREVGQMIGLLREQGLLENTLVVMTGDHGMPFPRAKGTLYDSGARVPLAVSWPARVPAGRVVEDLIGFTDFAPTFLEAAGLKPLKAMTGKSFLTVLTSDEEGLVDSARDRVFIERERHAICREGKKSYPVRAIRTPGFLYVRNLRPELAPAGESDFDHPQGIGGYGDVDGSPTKSLIVDRKNDPTIIRYYNLAFGRRAAEELYDVDRDPGQLENVAGEPAYADVQKRLRRALLDWMEETGDPRVEGETDFWDAKCPYVGGKRRKRPPRSRK